MQQLSAQDSSFIYLESPATPMHVASISFYDTSNTDPARLEEDAILRSIAQRLHLVPTCRRRLVHVPLEADYPYWLEDSDFDLEYHVRRIAVPKPGDWETLRKLCARILSRPLDMSKPLWEMYVIEGLSQPITELQQAADGQPTSTPSASGAGADPASGFAVLIKTHHAAVDGASGAQLLSVIHDDQAAPVTIPPPQSLWRPDPQPSDAELLMRSQFNYATQPFRLAERLGRQFLKFSQRTGNAGSSFAGGFANNPTARADRIPKTRFNGSVTPHRVIGSLELRLDDIKQIRRAVEGATVNDVVLTICGGALRHYLESKNELDETPLVAMAPVNARSDKSTTPTGNRVSALFVPIGTNEADPLARLRQIQSETGASKQIHSAVDASAMTGFADFVPAATAAMAARLMTQFAADAPAPPFNVSITNVPGPRDTLYFCGARMLSTMGYGPITQGMGLIFPIFSYCDSITVSFSSCRDMLPDPEYMEQCIQQSFDELQTATARGE